MLFSIIYCWLYSIRIHGSASVLVHIFFKRRNMNLREIAWEKGNRKHPKKRMSPKRCWKKLIGNLRSTRSCRCRQWRGMFDYPKRSSPRCYLSMSFHWFCCFVVLMCCDDQACNNMIWLANISIHFRNIVMILRIVRNVYILYILKFHTFNIIFTKRIRK